MTSSFFLVDNIKNEAILRDFLIFRSWQHQKRNKSARLLQFLNLTTSNTKQFCETSPIFELWQHQKQSNSARLLSKMESWVQSWQPRTNSFCDFSSPPVESTVLATKKWCHVIRSAAPVTQNSKPQDLMLQNATPLRKSPPGPAPMKMSLVLRLPRKMHLCRSSSNVPRLPSFLEMLQNPHGLLTFEKVHNPLTCHAKRHLNFQSGPSMVCFVHFDFEMCFAPQRCALFRHLNFQKWSGPGVFCTFWLRNMLHATTACNFSSLIWPAGSALRSHKSLEKHSVSRLSYLFAHLHLLSSDSFSSDLLSSNLSLLSASALLCFSSVHIVGSLTSKLPSIVLYYIILYYIIYYIFYIILYCMILYYIIWYYMIWYYIVLYCIIL